MATAEATAAPVVEANAHATNDKQYTFLSVLGQGSFGTVLMATDETKEELVAIKIVKARTSLLNVILRRKPKELTEAHQEVDILLQLQHPNVVALGSYYEFKVKHNQVGLAMVTEFCSNGSLQMYLYEMGAKEVLPDKEVSLQWYSQLSKGLHFIHGKGIVHRDLKPANILINGDNTLKIADVGLAKAVWDLKSQCNELPSESSFLQYMSSITGTPSYMAPEVWEEHYQVSSDVFSLGLIFVMISEVPNPLIPRGKWSNHEDSLGIVMYSHEECRWEQPTSLLVPSLDHSDSYEIQLFDCMLQYDYHKRPNMTKVITMLAEIESNRQLAITSTATREYRNCIIL